MEEQTLIPPGQAYEGWPYRAPTGGAEGRRAPCTLRIGGVYSVEEVHEWLDRTGWRFAYHRPLAGPHRLIVAEAASTTEDPNARGGMSLSAD